MDETPLSYLPTEAQSVILKERAGLLICVEEAGEQEAPMVDMPNTKLRNQVGMERKYVKVDKFKEVLELLSKSTKMEFRSFDIKNIVTSYGG